MASGVLEMEADMMNPKIQKLAAEIDRLKMKISDYQAKLRTLERQKTVLENEQIVAFVRNDKISDAELNDLMLSLRKGKPLPASLQKETEMEDNTYENTTYN